VLRLCYAAKRYAIQTYDLAGTALAQLYLADAQARISNIRTGIKFARQAREIFEKLGHRRNEMAAQWLLARLEQASQNFEDAKLEYQKALDLGQALQAEAKETALHKAVLFYERVIESIRRDLEDVGTAIANQQDQMYRFLDTVPVLRLSDGPGATVFERSNVIGYISTGEFIIEGCPYYLYPLGEVTGNRLKLKAGTVHFALPVPEDGWLGPASRKGDYALVRQETQAAQEGPGVLWTGERWVGGRFERNLTTGDIYFMAPPPHVIGKERELGYVIALLKPMV